MKREEIQQEQSYIDWLKSLGCVFYAPLTQDDLKDYISGNTGVLTGYGSMVWDGNENMYMFTSPSLAQIGKSVLSFNVNFYLPTTWTVIAKIKPISISGRTGCSILNSKYNDTDKLMTPVYGKCTIDNQIRIGSEMTYWDNKTTAVYRGTSSNGSIISNFYENGDFYVTQSPYSGFIDSYGLPTNINVIEIAHTRNRNNAYYGVSYYISDLMIFNQALDLNIMNEIAGL